MDREPSTKDENILVDSRSAIIDTEVIFSTDTDAPWDTHTGTAINDTDTSTVSESDSATGSDTATETASEGALDTGPPDDDGCPNGRYHVSTTGDNAQSGDTWAEAKRDVQVALDLAADHGCDVWVAEGTYRPTAQNGGDSDRYRTFLMREGVAIYGSFEGVETDPSERRIAAHRSVLSGELGVEDTRGDNARHVVTGADDAILDGFVVTRGNDDGYDDGSGVGGGMINISVSPTVQHCVFVDNRAGDTYYIGGSGGGIYNYNGTPTISDTLFMNNIAFSSEYPMGLDGGGAIYNSSASPVISDCRFFGNRSSSSMNPWTGGGAIANRESSPLINGCLFTRNHADFFGGALLDERSTSVISNSYFLGNASDGGGGGAYFSESASDVVNCVFAGNHTENDGCDNGEEFEGYCAWGGAIYSEGGPEVVAITHATFTGNVSQRGVPVSGWTSTRNSITWENWPEADGIENPLFRGDPLCSGQGWISATYDENTFRTTLVADAPCWDEDLSGMLIRFGEWLPETYDGVERYLIESSTEDTLVVTGNLTYYADTETYKIYDLHLDPGSPEIDRADDTLAPVEDITGAPRVDIPDAGGDDGGVADNGAYEYQPG